MVFFVSFSLILFLLVCLDAFSFHLHCYWFMPAILVWLDVFFCFHFWCLIYACYACKLWAKVQEKWFNRCIFWALEQIILIYIIPWGKNICLRITLKNRGTTVLIYVIPTYRILHVRTLAARYPLKYDLHYPARRMTAGVGAFVNLSVAINNEWQFLWPTSLHLNVNIKNLQTLNSN